MKHGQSLLNFLLWSTWPLNPSSYKLFILTFRLSPNQFLQLRRYFSELWAFTGIYKTHPTTRTPQTHQYIPAIFWRSNSKDCRAKYILVLSLLRKKEKKKPIKQYKKTWKELCSANLRAWRVVSFFLCVGINKCILDLLFHFIHVDINVFWTYLSPGSLYRFTSPLRCFENSSKFFSLKGKGRKSY